MGDEAHVNSISRCNLSSSNPNRQRKKKEIVSLDITDELDIRGFMSGSANEFIPFTACNQGTLFIKTEYNKCLSGTFVLSMYEECGCFI